VLFSVVAICVAICAEMLTPPAFTQEFARALARTRPSANVSVAGDLKLTIKEMDGLVRNIQLNNAYNEYKLDPQRFDDLVATFSAIFSQSASKEAELDRTRIIPVIKDRQWLDELHNTLKAKGVAQQHLADRFNNELVIVYAQDDPNRMRYLTTQEDFGLSREELKSLAIANLKRVLPKIEMRSVGDVSLMSAGGNYEASLLLIDDIWSSGQIQVNGDIVVAITDARCAAGDRLPQSVRLEAGARADCQIQGPGTVRIDRHVISLSRRTLHQIRLALDLQSGRVFSSLCSAARNACVPRHGAATLSRQRQRSLCDRFANPALAGPLTRARIRTSARIAWHRPAMPAD
jgi:hypothetical protein